MSRQTTLSGEDTRNLYVAFELSKNEWKLGFSDGLQRRPRIVSVAARDLKALDEAITRAKKRFSLAADTKVCSCYEAGRDGFWIHRALTARGFDNIVVDPASIEVSRRYRRAKTDRLDVIKLVNQLIRWHAGESRVWSVLRIPSVKDEDERHLHRELDVLKKTRRNHRMRIQSLLFAQGVDLRVKATFLRDLERVRLWDGSELPPALKERILLEHALLIKVEEALRDLKRKRLEQLADRGDPKAEKVNLLLSLRGVGIESAWLLGMEFFGWRQFNNRRQVAAAAGLCPTPFQSGDSPREQGISKAGNPRVRHVIVELAWSWLRFQPESALAQWYSERFAENGKRNRRIGIVALARRLLIELWKLVEYGQVPEGALMTP